MTQALDAWIVQLDTIEQEKSATKKTTADIMRETRQAEQCRENLLKPRGEKRKMDESQTVEGEEMGIGSISERRTKRL